MAGARERLLDRREDLAEIGVHHVVHPHRDHVGAGGAQARRGAVVDIAERAGDGLDLLPVDSATSGLARRASDTVAVETPRVSAICCRVTRPPGGVCQASSSEASAMGRPPAAI